MRQRAEARVAALDAAAASGIVAVHECAGPEIGGLDDWYELRTLTAHGVQVIGYWGEAVTSPAQARALIEDTGAAGLAGDLFVDGALGSRTAWLHRALCRRRGPGRNLLLGRRGHRRARAGVYRGRRDGGFPRHRRRRGVGVVAALERVVEDLGVAAVARCGHRLEHLEMVTADQAAKLGAWGVMASMQPNFDALWGGRDGMYARRLGVDRAGRLNPFALLASQGVALAFGSDAPVTGLDPWATVRAAANHHTPGSSVSVRAAFAAATRGGWRAGGVGDGLTGTLVPGAPASYAVWDVGRARSQRAERRRAALVDRSTVAGAGIAAAGPDDPLPRCRQTVHRGAVIHG